MREVTVVMDEELAARVDTVITESRFSGVVRVDRAAQTVLERAAGWANRAHAIPMTPQTRLAMASGSKGLTAITVLSLASDGTLPLDTRPGSCWAATCHWWTTGSRWNTC